MDFSNLELICCLFFAIIILIVLKKILLRKLVSKNIEIGYRSIFGKEEIQEDALEITSNEYGTLAILAQGFGKNEAGRYASNIAVNFINETFLKEKDISHISYFFMKAFRKANKEILKRIDNDAGGTSVTAALIKDNYLHYALIGNVMLCVFRKGELIKISEGHNIGKVAEKAYKDGKILKKEALGTLKGKRLICYLGQEPLGDVEMCEVPIKLQRNDIVCLMSKGIYENVRWIEIEDILKSRSLNMEDKSELIINRLNFKRNGSIILMKYCSK